MASFFNEVSHVRIRLEIRVASPPRRCDTCFPSPSILTVCNHHIVCEKLATLQKAKTQHTVHL